MAKRLAAADVNRFYMSLTNLLRSYQFRDRDRQTICGITVTQCYALEYLVHEGRLTVLDIGDRLALNKSNASRVVAGLEAIGAVSRARDHANHRIRWIEPTKYGRKLHGQITAGLKQEYSTLLRSFSPALVGKVSTLLDDLSARLRERQAKNC